MSRIHQELERLDRGRRKTLHLVESLSREEMNRRPVTGGWSAGELLDHLVLTEKLYRGELQELVDLARAGRRPYLNRLLTDLPFPFLDLLPRPVLALASVPLTFAGVFVPRQAVETFLRFPFIKVNAPPAIQPQAGQNADHLRRQLRESLASIRALFSENGDLDFRRFTYQHPILGLTNGVAMLGVIASHEERHQAQLQRIVTAVRLA